MRKPVYVSLKAWILHSSHNKNELSADKILPHAITTKVEKREKYEAQRISWLPSTNCFLDCSAVTVH